MGNILRFAGMFELSNQAVIGKVETPSPGLFSHINVRNFVQVLISSDGS